jgi:hypothetical protein
VTREQKVVDWRELAKTLTPRTQAFIDGQVPARGFRRDLRLHQPGEWPGYCAGRLL